MACERHHLNSPFGLGGFVWLCFPVLRKLSEQVTGYHDKHKGYLPFPYCNSLMKGSLDEKLPIYERHPNVK